MQEQTESDRPPLAARLRMVALATPPGVKMVLRDIEPDVALNLADALDAMKRPPASPALSDLAHRRIGQALIIGVLMGMALAQLVSAIARGLH